MVSARSSILTLRSEVYNPLTRTFSRLQQIQKFRIYNRLGSFHTLPLTFPDCSSYATTEAQSGQVSVSLLVAAYEFPSGRSKRRIQVSSCYRFICK
jgi:hypothetical protein